MRKTVGVLLLISLLLLGSQSLAFAQKASHGKPFAGGPEGVMDPFILNSLNLTEEQKSALWDLLFDDKKVSWGRENVMEDVLKLTIIDKPVDKKTASMIRERIEAHLLERYKKLHKVYSILTPNQRVMLKAKLDEGMNGPGWGNKKVKVKYLNNKNGMEHFFFMSKLNLSPGQKDKIKVIVHETSEKVRMNRTNLRNRFDNMFRLVWKDKPDWHALRLESKTASKEMTENLLAWQKAILDIKKELTPRQKRELMDYFRGMNFFDL